jgi:hypothetical protein
MNNNQSLHNRSLQLAKQAIGNILRELKVIQVVYVDDVFEEKQDVGKIIGWFAEAYNNAPAETQNLMPEIPFDEPDNVWRQDLGSQWEKLSADKQKEITIQLARIRGDQLATDFEVAGKMRSLFPRRVNFAELSPLAWVQQKEQILGRASPERKILCLFDQDLSEADGFTSTGTKSGIGLIQDVVSRDVDGSVICGLVTHTIHSLDGELREWRKLADENHLRLDHFLPIAKIRLADDASPLLFADGIKKTTLNTFCEKLKNIAIDILQKAHENAKNKLRELDVYDFDYIVRQC